MVRTRDLKFHRELVPNTAPHTTGLASTQSETENKLRQIERENDKLSRSMEQLKREHESQVQQSVRRVRELQETIAELEGSNKQLTHKAAALYVELHQDENA
jgi:chromosome segregation ATPase